MRCIYAAAVCLLAAAAALAAPPKLDIPAELKPESGYATYTPPADVKDIIYISHDGLIPLPAAILKDARILAVPTKGEAAKRYRFTAVASNAQGELSRADFVIPIGAEPDDVIPPPKPKPPEPKPEAVTSFRVLLIYESGATLAAEQKAVVYGVEVENAIRAATAGDAAKFAWRRLDKDADPATLPAGLREVWAKAKPALTEVPCVVLQANDKITIESLPATPTAGAELVAKHRGK